MIDSFSSGDLVSQKLGAAGTRNPELTLNPEWTLVVDSTPRSSCQSPRYVVLVTSHLPVALSFFQSPDDTTRIGKQVFQRIG
jgi:hypothetical protein